MKAIKEYFCENSPTLAEIVKLWRQNEKKPFEETSNGIKFDVDEERIIFVYNKPIRFYGNLCFGFIYGKTGSNYGINYISLDNARHLYKRLEERLNNEQQQNKA